MKMVNTQLVPIIYSRVIARKASKTKEQMKRVLLGTGVDEGGDKTSSMGMTAKQYSTLLENAKRESKDPYIAIKAAIDLPSTIHGPVGIAASNCATMKSSLEVTALYGCLRIPFVRIELIEKGKYTRCVMEAGSELGDQRDSAIDFLMSGIVHSIALIPDLPLKGFCVELTRPRPNEAQEFESLIPCPIRYGQEQNAMVFLTSELDYELPDANQEVYLDAIKRCNDIYSLHRVAVNEVDTVRNLFMRMSGQVCTIQQITDGIGMSARTLQRRLKKHGTSFQALLDEWLAKEASKYLLEENLTVEATSALLGYNDEANFRRAFKRWYGVSTGEYRETNHTNH